MSISAALIAALRADPAVAALAGARVFYKGARQGAEYPYVTIERISTAGAAHLDGPSKLDWARYQVDAWSPEVTIAEQLSEANRTALEAREITAGGRTFTATLQDQNGPAADEETRNFCASLDFYIWHERT